MSLFSVSIDNYVKFFQYFRITHENFSVVLDLLNPIQAEKRDHHSLGKICPTENPDRICRGPIRKKRSGERTYVKRDVKIFFPPIHPNGATR